MDFDLIKRKINFVRESIILAKEYLKDYGENNDRKNMLALERLAEEIVETSIKINKEILKSKKILPLSYKDSFLKLEILGLFDKEFIEILADTSTFRNELAHEYMGMSSFYSIENIRLIINNYPKYLLKKH